METNAFRPAGETETPFVAVVMAGGRSSRMGRDKAFIAWEGVRLIDRQVALLRALQPSEVIVSGRAGVEYGVTGVRIVTDAEPDLGPLGGIVAAIEATQAPHVLVLAVDLPQVSAEFLSRLLRRRAPGVGVVPRSRHGWEPLAAVYPREFLAIAQEKLTRRELALQRTISAEVAAVRMREFDATVDEGQLRNVNSPEDLGL